MITPMALAAYSLIALFAFGLAALVLIISRPTKEEGKRNVDKQVSSARRVSLRRGIASLLHHTDVDGEKGSTHMKQSSYQREMDTRRMVRFNAIAIICLSMAWACLTIGVFTFDPRSIVGITFLCLGLLSLITGIVFLVRYALLSQHIQKYD